MSTRSFKSKILIFIIVIALSLFSLVLTWRFMGTSQKEFVKSNLRGTIVEDLYIRYLNVKRYFTEIIDRNPRHKYVANYVQHDFAQFIDSGVRSDLIRDFMMYRDKYIHFKEVSSHKILPYEESLREQYTPFFGVRILRVGGDGGVDGFAFVSNLVCSDGVWQNVKCLGGFLTIDQITQGTKTTLRHYDGTIIGKDIKGLSSMGQRNSPFGYNSGDIDRDGRADFIVSNSLILSTHVGNKEEIDISAQLNNAFSGREVFVRTPYHANDVLAIPNGKDAISFVRLDSNGEFMKVDKKNIPIGLGELASKAPYVLYPVPDQDADGFEEILLLMEKGISILYSGLDYDHQKAAMANLIYRNDDDIRIGGFGDYTGDSIPDFWLAERGRDSAGTAYLVDGGALLSAAGYPPKEIERYKRITITGHEHMLRLNKDGIGSSLSRNAGDFDGDGIPDFSIASHYELDYTGTLYIIPGYLIQKVLEDKNYPLDLMSCEVVRLRPSLTAELAPPFYHYDDQDLNGDGYEDIVIAADNDGEVGPESGAVFILDGKTVKDVHQKRLSSCKDRNSGRRS